MPQMMPMEWMMLYITFLATFLMFNIMNYFNQSPNQQSKVKKIINTIKINWKW
uniref:ATP synthase F0 subunit 8 n=1 Tax=Labiotermes labralis TaxID=370423 RepID=A0A0A7EAG3_9NEOP|nr:ATP synthase F0 subunit 8 [Labiotermes labralis]AIY62039.1 ATP synthase F0 subunit 8 [Labiotermes labralis]ARQ29920.1 ATP synthase F0 subunit 8 [Labiotermes labralis]URH16531.1 ATP synthase F0 subunit 8 [Labiotermes labralis]